MDTQQTPSRQMSMATKAPPPAAPTMIRRSCLSITFAGTVPLALLAVEGRYYHQTYYYFSSKFWTNGLDLMMITLFEGRITGQVGDWSDNT